MKGRKVCLIGRVAPNKDFFDGQTIKTRLLLELLKTKTNWKITVVDTYYKKFRIYLFIKSVIALLRCKDVFICLSTNGVGVYYKILKFFIKFRKNRVFHYIVGGNHHNYLREHPKYIETSKKFVVNWAQTKNLVTELEKLGITNAKYMPNFKPNKIVDISSVPLFNKPPFKFVTFSRVIKEKGIDLAAEEILKINNENKSVVCTLDVYGKIEEDFAHEFTNIIKTNRYVHYCGKADPFKSGEVLKDYFVLLFPTRWKSEGFAATILDAYFGGVPVIASDWNCNSELVEDGKTGLVYPKKSYKTLRDAILYAINHFDAMNKMKINCVKFASYFSPDQYIDSIINEVEKNE